MVRIINRFESIMNSLDEIIHNKNDSELMGILTQLLEPNNVLFLLLLADVLLVYFSQLIDFQCSYKQETLCLKLLMFKRYIWK